MDDEVFRYKLSLVLFYHGHLTLIDGKLEVADRSSVSATWLTRHGSRTASVHGTD
jgi:hypothetical protein